MQVPPKPSKRLDKKEIAVVRSLYAYKAQNDDELSFDEGQVLMVLRKDKDWWLCRMDDKEGMVPANYVGENTATIDNPMHEAAKRGNLPFVKELISAGVSANSLDRAGNAPIHWACRGGHLDIVQLLGERNVALNVQNKLGDTPLHLASWGGHTEVVEYLLSRNVRVDLLNLDKQSALSIAKNDQCASLLINYASTAVKMDLSDEEEQ